MQRIGIRLFVNHNPYLGFNQSQQLDQNVLRIEIYDCKPSLLPRYQCGRPDMGQCLERLISTKNGRHYFVDRFTKGIRIAMSLGPNSALANSALANMSLDLSVEYSSNIHTPTWRPYLNTPLRVAIGQPPIRMTNHIPDWNIDFEPSHSIRGRYISIYTIRPIDHAFGLGTYYVGGAGSPSQTLFPSSQPQPHLSLQPQPRPQLQLQPQSQLQPQPQLQPHPRPQLLPQPQSRPQSQPRSQPLRQERAMQRTITPPPAQRRQSPADQGTRSRSTPRLRHGTIYDPLFRAYPGWNRRRNNDNDNENDGSSCTVVIKRMIGDIPTTSRSPASS